MYSNTIQHKCYLLNTIQCILSNAYYPIQSSNSLFIHSFIIYLFIYSFIYYPFYILSILFYLLYPFKTINTYHQIHTIQYILSNTYYLSNTTNPFQAIHTIYSIPSIRSNEYHPTHAIQ